MRIDTETHDRATVVRLRGELGAEDLRAFHRAVDQALAAGGRDFVLDMEGVETIDSKGLEALISLQDRAQQALGQVRLARAGDDVRTIFRITRLETRFAFHAGVDEALEGLR